jgi:uncharacterized protein YbjT (DUF2867 family)
MAAKIAHEKAMLAGPVPVRIVRAAQFHELVEPMIEWGRQGDVAYVPNMRTQLVAARTVAERVADLATHTSANGRIVEIAGPRVESMLDAATRLSVRRGDGLRIESVSNPADPDLALYESGAQLPGPNAILGGPTFQAWLEATPVGRAR